MSPSGNLLRKHSKTQMLTGSTACFTTLSSGHFPKVVTAPEKKNPNPKCKRMNPNPRSCTGSPAESPKEGSDNNWRSQDCGLGGEHRKPVLDQGEKKENTGGFFSSLLLGGGQQPSFAHPGHG